MTTFFANPNAQANSFGVRASPVVLLFGVIDVSFDIALGNWVVTPELLYWNLKLGTTETKLQGFGGALSYHFSGALVDSWYLGAFGKTLGIEVSGSSETGELDTTIIGGRAGYLWVWNTFYMNLGATLGSVAESDLVITNTTTSSTRIETIPTNGLGVGIDFKIGFSF